MGEIKEIRELKPGKIYWLYIDKEVTPSEFENLKRNINM